MTLWSCLVLFAIVEPPHPAKNARKAVLKIAQMTAAARVMKPPYPKTAVQGKSTQPWREAATTGREAASGIINQVFGYRRGMFFYRPGVALAKSQAKNVVCRNPDPRRELSEAILGRADERQRGDRRVTQPKILEPVRGHHS
jgi:hypothetical protein